MSKNQTNKDVISEDVALKELTEFVNHYSLTEKTEDEVKEEMNISLIAIQKGYLVIDSDFKPILKLKEPIKSEDDAVVMDSIEFITRVYPKDHVRLSKGLNMQKDAMQYMLNCIAHLAQLPSASYVNKFSKFDYTVIQQISTVFM